VVVLSPVSYPCVRRHALSSARNRLLGEIQSPRVRAQLAGRPVERAQSRWKPVASDVRRYGDWTSHVEAERVEPQPRARAPLAEIPCHQFEDIPFAVYVGAGDVHQAIVVDAAILVAWASPPEYTWKPGRSAPGGAIAIEPTWCVS